MKINNRLSRREAELRARRNLLAHSSVTSGLLKKTANRRVRHTAGIFNGGAYKHCCDIMYRKLWLFS